MRGKKIYFKTVLNDLWIKIQQNCDCNEFPRFPMAPYAHHLYGNKHIILKLSGKTCWSLLLDLKLFEVKDYIYLF